MVKRDIVCEVCCGSLQSALNARDAGAHRIELCSAFSLGGITPSYGLIEQVRKRVKIDLNVLIRPRSGDFLYEPEEVAVMISDIQACARMGVNGVVIGALDAYGNIDLDSCRAMVDVAKHFGMSVTFHRAIDRSRDIYEALEDVISLGVERVLTSGGKPSAIDALETIAAMNRLAAGRVTVMAGSGVNAENVNGIIAATGVSEVHFSAASHFDSPMVWRGDTDSSLFLPDSFIRTESSYETIQKIMAAIKSGDNGCC